MTHDVVMVLDDDEGLLLALPDTLRFKIPFIDVEPLPSPRRAVERLKDRRYGAIVADYRMPELNGLAFLREVKTVQPSTPVILLTATADPVLAHQALQAGAFDYLAKPVDRDELVEVVRIAIDISRRTRILQCRRTGLSQLKTRLALLEQQGGAARRRTIPSRSAQLISDSRALGDRTVRSLTAMLNYGEARVNRMEAQLASWQQRLQAAEDAARRRALDRQLSLSVYRPRLS